MVAQTMVPAGISGLVLPRFGTSRNLSRPTFGPEVGEVARRLGKPLMPWQQHAADVALEVDPVTGDLWYEEVDITVPRQSGKTTLLLALLVWRSITMARRLGPQTSTYLAQSGKMARRKLEREFIPILRRASSLRESPHPRSRPTKSNQWKPSMNNGSEHILFGTGSYLQIEAPTEKGSHGDVLDMPVIDEAFAHEGDLVEQAVDTASVTRRSPQLYVVSTKGNARSVYLWRKVTAGQAAVVAGTDSKVCYLEWSLPDDAPFDDESLWWEHLPALGHTITVERLRAKLEKALRNPEGSGDDDEDFPGLNGFRRGYLNQWVEVPPDFTQGRAVKLPADRWAATVVDEVVLGGPITIGFAASPDGEFASVAVAGGSLQSPYVELIAHHHRTTWLAEHIVERCRRNTVSAVGYYAAGASAAVSDEIRLALSEAKIDMPLTLLSTQAYKAACGGLYNDVVDGRLRRPAVLQGPLDVAAADATERVLGDAWAWDVRNSTVPICPLEAVTVARALLPVEAPPEPLRRAPMVVRR